jgi:hypothetical protein
MEAMLNAAAAPALAAAIPAVPVAAALDTACAVLRYHHEVSWSSPPLLGD